MQSLNSTFLQHQVCKYCIRNYVTRVLYLCFSIEDSNLLAGVIVLEEFCKEMAAVAFVKQHSLVSAV